MEIIQSYTKSLPIKLTSDQHIAKSRELTDLLQKRASLEITHKNRRDQMKEEISNLESQIGLAAGIVSRGEEYKDVLVDLYIGDNDTVIIKRHDTGETIETRPAQNEEKQMALKLFEDKEAEAQEEQEHAPIETEGIFVTSINDMPHSEPTNIEILKAENLAVVPEKPSKKGKIDLSTLQIVTVPQGGYVVSMNGIEVKDTYIKAAVMKLFKELGEDCDNPKILANRILKKYADCPERLQILNILSPDEYPIEEENNA